MRCIGVYYYGRNGYEKHWDEDSARAFVQYVAAQGGGALDIFRLLKDGEHDWPHDNFWWPRGVRQCD